MQRDPRKNLVRSPSGYVRLHSVFLMVRPKGTSEPYVRRAYRAVGPADKAYAAAVALAQQTCDVQPLQ